MNLIFAPVRFAADMISDILDELAITWVCARGIHPDPYWQEDAEEVIVNDCC